MVWSFLSGTQDDDPSTFIEEYGRNGKEYVAEIKTIKPHMYAPLIHEHQCTHGGKRYSDYEQPASACFRHSFRSDFLKHR